VLTNNELAMWHHLVDWTLRGCSGDVLAQIYWLTQNCSTFVKRTGFTLVISLL